MYTGTHAHLRTVNTSFFFSFRFFSPQLLPSLYSVVVVFVQVTARPVVVLLIIYLFIVQTLRVPRPTRKVAAIHTTGKVSTTRHLYICVPYTHIYCIVYRITHDRNTIVINSGNSAMTTNTMYIYIYYTLGLLALGPHDGI